MPLDPTLYSGLNRHGAAVGNMYPVLEAGNNIGLPSWRFKEINLAPHSGVRIHATASELGTSSDVEFALGIDTTGGSNNGKMIISANGQDLWAIDTNGNVTSNAGDTLVDATHTFSIKHAISLSGIFEVADQTFITQDGIDTRYAVKVTPNPMNGAQESAGIVIRIDPERPGDNFYGIYGEITANQVDTSSAFMKVITKGGGDALYIANYSNGVALESAAFGAGNRGIISTLQNVNGAFDQFGNNTLFQGVWGYDGTGGATVPPNYGALYIARSLGNSFLTRKQDPNATGAAEGRTEWKISEFDLSRDRVQIYNNGESRFQGLNATNVLEHDSPLLRLVSSHWNGSSAVDMNAALKSVPNGGSPELYFYVGPLGSETLVALMGTTALDMQGHDIVNIGTVTAATLQASTALEVDTVLPLNSGQVTFETSVNITGNLTVAGFTSLQGTDATLDTVTANETIIGNQTVGGTMSVGGLTTLSGNLDVIGFSTVSGVDNTGAQYLGINDSSKIITSTYPVQPGDCTLICDSTGGDFTVTLPPAASNKGRLINVKQIATAGIVYVAGNTGSEKIDGASNTSLATQWNSLTVICNGANWFSF